MSPSLRAQFRVDLLRLAAAAGATGMRAETLLVELRNVGYTGIALAEDVVEEIQYWRDKGFIAAVDGAAGPLSDRYRVTAAGRDQLDREARG